MLEKSDAQERPSNMTKLEAMIPQHLHEALAFFANDRGETPDRFLERMLKDYIDAKAKNYKSHDLPDAVQLERGDILGSLQATVGTVVMGKGGLVEFSVNEHPVSRNDERALASIKAHIKQGVGLPHPLGHMVRIVNPITQEMLTTLEEAISDATVHNIHMIGIPAFLHEKRKQRT